MPLLDHFRPPLSRTHPWRGFHGAWAAAIARLLNAGVLPPGYYAVPLLDRDGPFEIDVATLREFDATAELNDRPAWEPSAATLAVAVEWPPLEDVRVEIFTDDGDPKLAATIELVSPRNKDRPKAREAFAAKCADHLRHGCGVVIVDVVTTRTADLNMGIFSALDAELPVYEFGPLNAVAYRPIGREGDGRLLAWPHALGIGQLLPTVPLWIGGDQSAPFDLEASHTAACVDLRIRRGA
jgi:hypothetical protein